MKKTTTRLLALSLCMALTVLTGCGSSKNQFTPPENPYDSLELSEYVTLPDYSTYQTKALDVTVTDEQIEAEIESRLEAAATTEKVTEPAPWHPEGILPAARWNSRDLSGNRRPTDS